MGNDHCGRTQPHEISVLPHLSWALTAALLPSSRKVDLQSPQPRKVRVQTRLCSGSYQAPLLCLFVTATCCGPYWLVENPREGCLDGGPAPR